ncbi:hypothetical protein JD969_11605 [Planctomycetota bacterium]|nr:hypothetical protein JD969_11605 [Planctomycetota bacterium]
MSKPKRKLLRRALFTFALLFLIIILGEAIRYYIKIDTQTARTLTGYSFFGYPISQTEHDTQISKIYLKNHDAPADIHWHIVTSTGFIPITGSFSCRCYSSHNYNQLMVLEEIFKQYNLKYKQPYPKNKQRIIAEELINTYLKELKPVKVSYTNDQITIEPLYNRVITEETEEVSKPSNTNPHAFSSEQHTWLKMKNTKPVSYHGAFSPSSSFSSHPKLSDSMITMTHTLPEQAAH